MNGGAAFSPIGVSSLVLVAALLPVWSPAAENNSPPAARLKADFLLRLADYVQWTSLAFPKERTPFTIGVLGDHSIGMDLTNRGVTRLQGRPLRVQEFKGGLEFRGAETPGRRQPELEARRAKKRAELRSCHILFVGSSEDSRLGLILQALRRSSVLTVSESDAFMDRGGVVRLVATDAHIEFEVGLEAARRAGLEFSPRLLKLAKAVHPAAGKR